MTNKKSSIALRVSQYFINYFANSPRISAETYGQVILRSITEFNNGNEYELVFEIPSIKSLQTRLPLTQKIVENLNMTAVDKLYQNNAQQLILTFDLEAPIHVALTVDYPDSEDAKITDVQSNVKLLKSQYKIHPTATTVSGAAIKVFGNGNPERLQFMLPYLQDAASETLDAIFSDPALKKETFKSWDIEAFEPSPRDIQTLTEIYNNSNIAKIEDLLRIASERTVHFSRQTVFKDTIKEAEKEKYRQLGGICIKDVASILYDYANINTQSIDTVAAQLSKIRNNDISRVLKMSIPQSLIAASEKIYEIQAMLKLYNDSVKSLNNNDCQEYHVESMKRLNTIINNAINQLLIAEKMFKSIID